MRRAPGHAPASRRRRAVAHETALEQQLDEIGGLGRTADLPLRAVPPVCAKQRPDLAENVVDLVGAEALTLNGVPSPSRTHAERETGSLDPLVSATERSE
jgi:hypothetical protein